MNRFLLDTNVIWEVRKLKPHGKKAQEIEAWADLVAGSYNVLSMDAACFRAWGRIMEESPERFAEDAMIAATALVHGLTVATRNERDFHRFRVRVFNPFKVNLVKVNQAARPR